MELVLFIALASAAVFVYSFAGFGGALLVVPVLARFMDLQVALPALTLSGFAMNCFLLTEARRHVEWKAVGWMLLGAAVGTPLGVVALTTFPQQWTGLVVSLLAMGTGLIFLFNVHVPIGPGRIARVITGLTAGLLAGGTATPGPPAVLYGLARKWPKDRFRANLIFFFSGLGTWTLMNFAVAGLLTKTSLSYGAAAFVPMFIASAVGIRLKQRVSEAWFRTAVLWLLIVTGFVGALRSLTG